MSGFLFLFYVAVSVAILAFVLQRSASEVRLASLPSILVARWRIISLMFVLAGFASTLIVVWVLRAFPNSADEYGYIYEAQTFLAGRLWNPLPPGHHLFTFLHIFEKDGKWVSQYPFGWSSLLAIGGFLQLPYWLVCPMVGALFLFTVAKLGQLQNGPLGAVLALALIALSPFFLFNAASYFNILPAATAGALFCWAAARFLDNPCALSGVLAGVALGCVGVIRTTDVIIFLLPFLIQFLRVGRLRHYVLAPTIALGGLPLFLGLLFYNRAITGSAFLPVVSWGYPLLKLGLYPSDELGNHSNPSVQLFTIVYNIIDLARWTSPLLIAGYIVAFRRKIASGDLGFFDFVFPSTVFTYFFWIGLGGNRYGPRYYFVGYPFLVLTVVSVLAPMLSDRSEEARIRTGLVISHLVYCLAATVTFSVFFRGVVNERMDMYDQVQERNLHNAVIIVHSTRGQYLPFTPEDLTRNGITVDGDVIYALDVPGGMIELKQLFPQRQFYIYTGKTDGAKGELKLLSNDEPSVGLSR